MRDKLINEILRFHPKFSIKELDRGFEFFELKRFKAKDIVAKKGKVSNYLFFSESSISRSFYLDQEGTEQTLWMKPEQTFVTDFKSFTSQTPSEFSLQFYEDTSTYCISRENLLKLYETSNDWALFGVLLTEKLHVTLIDVFVNLLANDATRNYQYIEYAFPRFIQVAPLKDIASMLQVSQVTLSRIRSGTQVKK